MSALPHTTPTRNPCINGTPIVRLGSAMTPTLWVKCEHLCCPGGPNFSKMRGVFAHIEKRPARTIGVLDTYHSQAGHAVARAGQLLGRRVINFYPEYTREPGPRAPQRRAEACGAELVGLKAGMSAVLWHQARARLHELAGEDAYMMPNGLQLAESLEETKAEVLRSDLPERLDGVVVSASSGTIAAGVVAGFLERVEFRLLGYGLPTFWIHMGYSRSQDKMRARFPDDGDLDLVFIDEGYSYKDRARPCAVPPPFPCNPYYDLKAWRWYMGSEALRNKRILFWNIGD